jgi:hypothetical protein
VRNAAISRELQTRSLLNQNLSRESQLPFDNRYQADFGERLHTKQSTGGPSTIEIASDSLELAL